jgi:flagellar basal body rod protein FlgC
MLHVRNEQMQAFEQEALKRFEDGMVEQANISTIEEMMDVISASRAYQANLSALKQSRDMARRTITLGQPS